MELVVATRNANKLREMLALFEGTGVGVQGLGAFPEAPPTVVEDGTTFEANASKKARKYAAALNRWVIADDSGLEVRALDGAPGVYSARYAGPDATDAENNEKLLNDLEGVSDRRAAFVCVLALAAPSKEVWTVRGTCEGTIGWEEKGQNGFGYDPLFVPKAHTVRLPNYRQGKNIGCPTGARLYPKP